MTTMRRNATPLFAGAIALVAAAGCYDMPAAPKSHAPAPSSAATSFDRGGIAHGTTATFVISPRGGSYDVVFSRTGDEPAATLIVPAGAVASPVTVTATLYDKKGIVGIDFAPELVFNPQTVVTLSTMRLSRAVFAMESRAPSQQNWSTFAMLYTPDGFQTLVDDAKSDPSVVTNISLSTGRVWRRVKHFSGYSSGTGEACDPSVQVCPDSGTVAFQQ